MEAKSPARLVRWALRLSEFNFETRYKKGSLNSNVDALSRLPDETQQMTEEEDNPLEAFLYAHRAAEGSLANLNLKEEQSKDPYIASIRNSIIQKTVTSKHLTEFCEIEDEILYYREDSSKLLFVQQQLVPTLLEFYHANT